jgi:hypothetical protein
VAGDRISATLKETVTDLISQLCDSYRMPLFMERMLRGQ